VTLLRPSLRRRLSVEGPRDADDVWDRYLRPDRWPEWSPQIRSVDYAGLTIDGFAPAVLFYLPVAHWALRRLVAGRLTVAAPARNAARHPPR
jgi:hypothetical protein